MEITDKKNRILTIVLLLQIFICNSQTFFETKFYDNRGNSYLGFMVYYNENNCYMRVAFSHTDKYQVVNVDYKTLSSTENGINYIFFIGENPKYISGDQLIYNPEYFIWVWDNSNTTNKIFYTTDPAFSEESFKETEYFREIKLNQLSETYLRQFYYNNEKDYLSFVNAINRNNINSNNNIEDKVSLSKTTPKSPVLNDNVITLHLIIAANTKIGDIGQSCLIDKNNIQSEFEGIADVLKMPIKKYIIEGEAFSKTALLSIIEELKVKPNDVIVFFYTGHGFRWNNQTDKYPNFDLRSNTYQQIDNESSISQSVVYNSLTSKRARLTIVLSNCCNSNVGINQMTTTTFLTTMSNQNYNLKNLSKLLIKSKGSVLATAASPGEYAWCNSSNGGFFTVSFIQSLRKEIGVLNYEDVTWNKIIFNTINIAKSKTSNSTSCNSCKIQNGLHFIRIE